MQTQVVGNENGFKFDQSHSVHIKRKLHIVKRMLNFPLTYLRGVLALDLGAPDGVRHRPDREVEEVPVVPLELRLARQPPHERGVQLLPGRANWRVLQ